MQLQQTLEKPDSPQDNLASDGSASSTISAPLYSTPKKMSLVTTSTESQKDSSLMNSPFSGKKVLNDPPKQSQVNPPQYTVLSRTDIQKITSKGQSSTKHPGNKFTRTTEEFIKPGLVTPHLLFSSTFTPAAARTPGLFLSPNPLTKQTKKEEKQKENQPTRDSDIAGGGGVGGLDKHEEGGVNESPENNESNVEDQGILLSDRVLQSQVSECLQRK